MLVVVADASGSMRELGKAMVLRGLLAFIRQSIEYKTLSSVTADTADSVFVIWGSSVETHSAVEKLALPRLNPMGRAQVEDLLTALEAIEGTSDSFRLLFLSDGCWSRKLADCLHKGLSTARKKFRSQAIAVGSDADMRLLERIFGRGNVYLAESALKALSSVPVEVVSR